MGVGGDVTCEVDDDGGEEIMRVLGLVAVGADVDAGLCQSGSCLKVGAVVMIVNLESKSTAEALLQSASI
jgi:hypothetical protein